MYPKFLSGSKKYNTLVDVWVDGLADVGVIGCECVGVCTMLQNCKLGIVWD